MNQSLLEKEFNSAAHRVKYLDYKPTDEYLLLLYGLYKQALNGDCDKEKPWIWQIEESKKWEAWKSRSGIKRQVAMKEYIFLVQKLENQEI